MRRWVAVLACTSAVAALAGAGGAGASPVPPVGPGHGIGIFAGATPWTGRGPAANNQSVQARGAGPPAAAAPPTLQVVATGLNQPQKVTVGPDGALYVADAGLNTVPSGCTDGTEVACVNLSGSIDRVTPAGQVSTVVDGLPSVNAGSVAGSLGPSEAVILGHSAEIAIGNSGNDQTTGAPIQGGADTALLDSLTEVTLPGGEPVKQSDLGAYEAQFNPDQGAGSSPGQNPPIDSNPYAVVPFEGGLAIADAAGNDVLLYRAGQVSTLAVLPLVPENIPADFFFPGSPAITFDAQAVPTSLAVGPDGQLYVGYMGGYPDDVGNAGVYRIGTGGSLSPIATGLTMVGDIAFDRAGRLLVLEIDQAGLLDPMASGDGVPTPGALIRIDPDGTQTVLASTGLVYPLGMAVAGDGSIYVTNFGVVQGQNDPYHPGLSGELVRVADDDYAYREAASDGGIFSYGGMPFYGSTGGVHLVKPVVGMAPLANGPGYWEVASDGGIFSFGGSQFYGSTGGVPLVEPIVGMAPTPDGRGYYLFASDGGVFTFGDAVFHGSLGGVKLVKPVVASAVTPDGSGYYLFASDGGVFTFGGAAFHGSLGGVHLVQPIVSAMTTPGGGGYRMAASDGGVFDFGDATFAGSAAGLPLVKPIIATG